MQTEHKQTVFRLTYLVSDASKYITGEVLNIDGSQRNGNDAWFGGRLRYFEFDYEAACRVD